jgi:phosphoribosylformylglycinamidine synthase
MISVGVALRFVDGYGVVATLFPENPNGSPGGMAGVTSDDGRATILMPHPERTLRAANFSWYPPEWKDRSPWMRMFQNARKALA